MAAERIVSADTEFERIFLGMAEILSWVQTPAVRWVPGDAILFPGPTVGRKGAYEVREAARRLGLRVQLLGRDLEGEGFWEGIEVEMLPRAVQSFEGCFAVVQPSLVEERPTVLLQALASGVPLLASPACGVQAESVPVLDADALVEAIRRAQRIA
jgi:glycosyltransferase involved in cell wall biosynthesis